MRTVCVCKSSDTALRMRRMKYTTQFHTRHLRQPYTFSLFLLPIIFSSPLNAPEAMKRMFVVSTVTTLSALALRELLSTILTEAPSRILSSPCCTPSPPTSRRWWKPGTQLILSTSSRNTMPAQVCVCVRGGDG